MDQKQVAIVQKRLGTPDEVREFLFGRFEVVRLGGMTIGPGKSSCDVEHIGMVISGCAMGAHG